MWEFFRLFIRNSKIGIRHNPATGFDASAEGGLGIVALLIIIAIVAVATVAAVLVRG